jgi:sugar/nucleoside kinase (ribokinase family)
VPKIAKDLIVDTNGAGDSFVGGFFAALSRGESVIDCVKAGVKLSGIVVQHLGCAFD